LLQKDGNKPGDPNYDQRTLLIPNEAWKEFTPFEKQVWMSDLNLVNITKALL